MPTVILTESRADLGRNNLSVLITFESLACGLFTLLHWLAGGLLYTDENALIVYGREFVDLGGWMVLLGFVAILYCLAGVYAARFHNRVVILACIALQTVSIVGEAVLADAVRATIHTEFAAGVAEDCLTQLASEEHEDTLCPEYFRSNRTAALWSLWQYWVDRAKAEGTGSDGAFQRVLLQIQSGYDCCGFSRPQMCRVNRTLVATTTDVYAPGVTFAGACGNFETLEGVFQPVERWYPPTDDCDITIFEGAAITYQGGCPFDLPYGASCVTRSDYDTDPYVSGCAVGVEEYVNDDLAAIIDTMLFMIALQTVFVVTLLCFFFKRKVSDVTPPQGWQKMSDGFDD